MTKPKKLLVVLTHPDDETVMGATLARYSRAGVAITLVCTTNGGGGNAPEGVSQNDLAVLRKEALRCACRELGVERVEFFEDREKLPFLLGQKNYGQVVGRHGVWLGELIADTKPDTVVTWGPEGLTGHPSHVMTGLATTQAILRVSPQTPLYCIAYSEHQIQRMYAWIDANPEVMSRYAEEVKRRPNLGAARPVMCTTPDALLSVEIPVGGFLESKRCAWRCHNTQGGGGEVLEVFGACSAEGFTRVSPSAGVTGMGLFGEPIEGAVPTPSAGE